MTPDRTSPVPAVARPGVAGGDDEHLAVGPGHDGGGALQEHDGVAWRRPAAGRRRCGRRRGGGRRGARTRRRAASAPSSGGRPGRSRCPGPAARRRRRRPARSTRPPGATDVGRAVVAQARARRRRPGTARRRPAPRRPSRPGAAAVPTSLDRERRGAAVRSPGDDSRTYAGAGPGRRRRRQHRRRRSCPASRRSTHTADRHLWASAGRLGQPGGDVGVGRRGGRGARATRRGRCRRRRRRRSRPAEQQSRASGRRRSGCGWPVTAPSAAWPVRTVDAGRDVARQHRAASVGRGAVGAVEAGAVGGVDDEVAGRQRRRRRRRRRSTTVTRTPPPAQAAGGDPRRRCRCCPCRRRRRPAGRRCRPACAGPRRPGRRPARSIRTSTGSGAAASIGRHLLGRHDRHQPRKDRRGCSPRSTSTVPSTRSATPPSLGRRRGRRAEVGRQDSAMTKAVARSAGGGSSRPQPRRARRPDNKPAKRRRGRTTHAARRGSAGPPRSPRTCTPRGPRRGPSAPPPWRRTRAA